MNDIAAIRHLRNFVIITLLSLVILLGCFYATGVLVLVSINNDWNVINAYFEFTLTEQFWALAKAMMNYWGFYFKHFSQLKFDSFNYFVPKLWLSTLFPYTTLAIIGFIFRAPIADFRPFKKTESIHGNARWANPKDIKKMGLRSKQGLLLGKHKSKFLIADGYQHCLLFAPTGSGKGVGFVIPNLLFWKDSVIVHDIKLENYELTSGWRKKTFKTKSFFMEPCRS